MKLNNLIVGLLISSTCYAGCPKGYKKYNSYHCYPRFYRLDKAVVNYEDTSYFNQDFKFINHDMYETYSGDNSSLFSIATKPDIENDNLVLNYLDNENFTDMRLGYRGDTNYCNRVLSAPLDKSYTIFKNYSRSYINAELFEEELPDFTLSKIKKNYELMIIDSQEVVFTKLQYSKPRIAICRKYDRDPGRGR